MNYEFILTIFFLVVLVTIQFTLNKILNELKIISTKLDKLLYKGDINGR